ncbi:terminase small subunit [Escherichia coli]|nr:terminase small subunit [Escherichia coli]SQS29603.1 terminase small subunit [Escherichia coli]
MSRPDWGALQQEYIAEYTRSGISRWHGVKQGD